MNQDLRHHLRHRTQSDHENVDRVMSRFDLTTLKGFSGFLAIHHSSFRAIQYFATADSPTRLALDEMVQRLSADLATLGAAEADFVVPSAKNIDGLAIDYLIEGSRLGSQILKRRWMAAEDPRIRNATAYFSLPPDPQRWRAVCDQLSAVPAQSDRAEAIVEDTRFLFGLFYNTARTQLGQTIRLLEPAV